MGSPSGVRWWGKDLVNMGIGVLDARTGAPQGGATIPLTIPHDRDLTLSVLPTTGISAEIDLTGDGQADVEVFDRLTQRRDVMNPGSPGEHRQHELEVVGPAVRTQWRGQYRVDNGMIVSRPSIELPRRSTSCRCITTASRGRAS